jgi:TRAP-type C4-dicarboxylate transport system permease small subunit
VRRFFHQVNQIFSGICGWLMLAMMILLVIDIISRSFARPIQGMAELSVFVMMITIYLGMARCEENKEHVALEIVLNYLPPSRRRIANLLTSLLAVVSAGLLLYAVLLNAINSFRTNESLDTTVELAIWPVKFVIVLGLIFFWIQTIIHSLEEAKKLKKSKNGIDGSETDRSIGGDRIY